MCEILLRKSASKCLLPFAWTIRVSVLYHLPYFFSLSLSPSPFVSYFHLNTAHSHFALMHSEPCFSWQPPNRLPLLPEGHLLVIWLPPAHAAHVSWSPGDRLREQSNSGGPQERQRSRQKARLQLCASRAFIFSIPFCFIPLSAFSLLYSPHSVGLFLWLRNSNRCLEN